MPSQQKFFLLVMVTACLFSCTNKKNSSKSTGNVSTLSTAADTINFTAGDAISVAGLNNDFIKSITQKFTVPSTKVSVITGKKGLKVTVNPSALENVDGSTVAGNINVSITELTNSEDLFKSNAATVSNERLLVSGGSYFIGMESTAGELRIKNNQQLQVDFPKLKEDEMELFYGNRDASGSMNWEKAGERLSFAYNNSGQSFMDYNPPYPDSAVWKPYSSKYELYGSAESKVFFDGKRISIREMATILQRRGVDKVVDSVDIPLRKYYKTYYIEGDRFIADTIKRYRIISCKDLETEKDSLAKANKIARFQNEANRKYNEEWVKNRDENLLEGQLQKYYAPAGITKLGWINCDRFYNNPQNTDVPLEIPITLNNNNEIEYFIVYKSFSGLVNGTLVQNKQQQYILPKLPAGEAVSLIAFVKNNGQTFHCKEDFVIQPNKPIKLDFKNISAEELGKIFGKNIKI